MSEGNEIKALVLDTGSGFCKAGFAGDDTPRSVFPTIYGIPKETVIVEDFEDKGAYIGYGACERAHVFSLRWPIQHGIVTNWDYMDRIFHYIIYNQFRVDSEEHPVLLTETPTNQKANREKMIQLMFDTYMVPSFYIELPAVLSLYASGNTTGIGLDSGDEVSYAAPVYEGYSIPQAIMKLNLAGRDLTAYLEKLLHNRADTPSYKNTAISEMETVRDIKEKQCYVALDYDAELEKVKSSNECDVSYTLPGGQVNTSGDERFRCPELLFKPHMNDFNFDGIPRIIFDSIMKCNIDFRKDLYANIVLSGGSTMFEGFPERLEKEITSLAPKTAKINVVAPPNRMYSAFAGGSILASLPTFPQMAVTREEYEEVGPEIVHRKCL